MTESQIDVCGKCWAEIDPTRRVDYTLKDGTRVCDLASSSRAAFSLVSFICRALFSFP
jgi:hypothetical protein